MTYNITRKTTGDFETVIGRVKDLLKTEGFGVLTEIDVEGRSRRRSTRISAPTAFSAPAIRPCL